MSRPSRLTCAVFSLVISLAQFCAAQSIPSSSPNFAAATIKPSDPNRTNPERSSLGWNPGGSFGAKSMSLKQLIEFAHDIGYLDVDQRIIGGPKWMRSAKFDIEAKCDEATASTFGKLSVKQQIRVQQSMVQALLVDRFKLRSHHELRRLPVYVLVQARSGSKMKSAAAPENEELRDADGPPGNWHGDGVKMEDLANDLGALPEIGGRIVVDKTSLNGRFNFQLKWTPDPTMSADPATSPKAAKSDPSAPSLLTALQEQLGLKLETSKESVDVIVIDSAEQPSPN